MSKYTDYFIDANNRVINSTTLDYSVLRMGINQRTCKESLVFSEEFNN